MKNESIFSTLIIYSHIRVHKIIDSIFVRDKINYAKGNHFFSISHSSFYFYKMISALKLFKTRSCFDMVLIDSFYTQREDNSDLWKDFFFCLAHISHLSILIQLKEIRTVWPMNEPYFNRGHFYLNWSVSTTVIVS